MPVPDLIPEVTVWTDADRAGITAELIQAMGDRVKPIGVGGPRTAPVNALAQSLDCPCEDDLRKLAIEHPAAFVFIASMRDVEPQELLAVIEQGSVILTLEPPAVDLLELASLTPRSRAGDGMAGSPIVLLPSFQQSLGFLRTVDPYGVLGDQRMVGYVSCGRPAAGSLFARLFDAWRVVLSFIEMPESIDASVTPAADLTDDLRQTTGRLGAHARVADDAAAVLQISDQAGDERRYLHVVGRQAEVRITDTGYDLRQSTGDVIDRGDVNPQGIRFVELAAMQWRRLLDQPDHRATAVPPHRDRDALACCIACLLSARTTEPESPLKLIRMTKSP